MLTIVVGILVICMIILVAYIAFLQLQLRSINRQLNKRLTENTRQLISLELINKELNTLAININKCLKAEETLRLSGIRKEKNFKELIANISHDLRTPVTAIKGYQQLMEKGELSDKQQKQLQIAQKHANELGNLIEQFFEYSYLLNADSQPNIKQLNLTNLVTECLADSIAVFEENQLTVNLEETQPVFVFADKEMTVRIVHNLIRNCVTHSVGTIKVAIQNKENAVVSFTNPVKKSGDIEIDRLFDRFYTADKARSKNAGLGLSIVQKLAEQMGGRASASLNKDIITICVELPLSEKG